MNKMTTDNLIQKILKIESDNQLDNLYIEGIPLWHVVRYRLRGWFFQEHGVNDISKGNNTKLPVNEALKFFVISFIQFAKLLYNKKHAGVCFFGFTRLESINGTYIDKFVDPIIQETNIKDYFYFNNQYKTRSKPRLGNRKIIYTDVISVISLIAGLVLFPLLYIWNARVYKQLISVTRAHITKKKKASIYLYVKSSEIFVQSRLWKIVFKVLKTKSIVGVSRVTFMPQSIAAKQLGIRVIELQHGITMGATNLYSGYYDSIIDPDIFCTFGSLCPLNVFGIPQTKIVEIGWAFKNYIAHLNNNVKTLHNTILFISEPEISDILLGVIEELAYKLPDFNFHIRRHPQENYNDIQLDRIKIHPNISDVSSRQCSQLAILPYQFIAGENSSVLFEALSVGKHVCRFNCRGLSAIGYEQNVQDGFYYINSLDEFRAFVNNQNITNAKTQIYSDFNTKLFMSLIN